MKYSSNVFIQEMSLRSKLSAIFKRDLAIYFRETIISVICEYFFTLYENIRLIYLKKKKTNGAETIEYFGRVLQDTRKMVTSVRKKVGASAVH